MHVLLADPNWLSCYSHTLAEEGRIQLLLTHTN